MIEDRRDTDEALPGQRSVIALRHLRYAVSAAEHGSFRRAAGALLLRQSTLSSCIRQLENSIEMIVFDRSSGGVTATPAGRDFLRTARSILEQVEALMMNARSAGRGDSVVQLIKAFGGKEGFEKAVHEMQDA